METNWNFDYTQIPVFHSFLNFGYYPDTTSVFTLKAPYTTSDFLIVINSMEQLQENVAFENGMPEVFNTIDFETQSILGVREEDYGIYPRICREMVLTRNAEGKSVFYTISDAYLPVLLSTTPREWLIVMPKAEDFSATTPDMYYTNNPPVTVRSFIDEHEGELSDSH